MKWNFSEYSKLSKLFSDNELRARDLKPSKKLSSEVVGAIQFYELVSIYKSEINSNNIYFFSQNKLVEDPSSRSKIALFEWLELEFSETVVKTIDSS